MAMPHVIEGTWDEIAEHAREFPGKQRFRLVPLPPQEAKPSLNGPGQMIRKGMFPLPMAGTVAIGSSSDQPFLRRVRRRRYGTLQRGSTF
jgi:hypothetical protein